MVYSIHLVPFSQATDMVFVAFFDLRDSDVELVAAAVASSAEVVRGQGARCAGGDVPNSDSAVICQSNARGRARTRASEASPRSCP